MKTFFKYCLGVPACILLLFVFFGLSFRPSVIVDSAEQVDNAESITPLLQQTRDIIRNRFKPHQLSINEVQASSLAGFTHRAHAPIRIKTTFEQDALFVHVSYQLTSFLYLNLETVLESGESINLQGISVGQLYFPGNTGLVLARFLTDWYTHSDIAFESIKAVKSVDISADLATFHLHPLNAALRQIREIDIGGEDEESREEKLRIAHYLRFLDQHNFVSTRSLHTYLKPLMQEASIRSVNGVAALENQAAIYALAIYAGDKRFAAAVGNMDFAINPIPTSPFRTELHRRVDLGLHFIFSAAIKLLSEQGFSFAVGEFKELMDRAHGGSGYSFVDLAADMAGVHFALLAVSPEHAKDLQLAIIESADESVFMPSIAQLDEGMSKAEFTQRYGKVDSLKYKAVVDVIQKRLDSLPISSIAD